MRRRSEIVAAHCSTLPARAVSDLIRSPAEDLVGRLAGAAVVAEPGAVRTGHRQPSLV